MPNIYNDILWQKLLGENEVEICLQPTELPTDIYQPTNSTLSQWFSYVWDSRDGEKF